MQVNGRMVAPFPTPQLLISPSHHHHHYTRYFAMKGTAMVPTLLGFVVVQLLERHFPDFVDAGFTSRMEAALDEIARGKVDRVSEVSRSLITSVLLCNWG